MYSTFFPTSENSIVDDPFLLPSTKFMPKTLDSAMDVAAVLYCMNEHYRQATNRMVSHFVNPFDYATEHGDRDERKKHDAFLTDTLRLPEDLQMMGNEWGCYGNAMRRIHFPFHRVLVDTRSGSLREWSLSVFGEMAEFELSSMTYKVPDPTGTGAWVNRPKVAMKFRDRKLEREDEIRTRPLDPRHMFIEHARISGKSRYIYDFEPELRADVKKGVLCQVNETPIGMLKAIRDDKDYKFADGHVFHFTTNDVVGLSPNGWGIPQTFLNYRNLHQLQVYRKIDEHVGNQFMLPFRMFSPMPQGGGDIGVPKLENLGLWSQKMRQVMDMRRKDPTLMHAFPFPVQYQEFGGDGKNLVTKDLIEYQTDAMLHGVGYPSEIFKSSLRMEQFPTALRLFENANMSIHRGFERYIRWVSSRTSGFLGRPNIEPSLQLPSMADDLEKRHIWLQLSSGGEFPRGRALRPFGVDDPVEAFKERIDEDIQFEKVRQEAQSDYEREVSSGSVDSILAQQETAGGEAAPMAAPTPGGQSNVSPLDIDRQAEELAMKWLNMEVGDRRKDMTAIEVSQPQLHALAMRKMENMRQEGASAGRAQAGQMAPA
jgi:hypothetical protein